MSIPLANRIQVRTLLSSIYEMTDNINSLMENIRKGRKGEVAIPVGDFVKLLEEVRRVEYIMISIAASSFGASLLMPPTGIDAVSFRAELDAAILTQLKELDNTSPKIILTDNGDGKIN